MNLNNTNIISVRRVMHAHGLVAKGKARCVPAGMTQKEFVKACKIEKYIARWQPVAQGYAPYVKHEHAEEVAQKISVYLSSRKKKKVLLLPAPEPKLPPAPEPEPPPAPDFLLLLLQEQQETNRLLRALLAVWK